MPHQDYIGPDGEPWPSATELTSLLPQAWILAWYKASVKKWGWRGWQHNLALSNRGLRIGTDVHALLEGFIHKKDVTVRPKYDSQAIADALFDAVNPSIDEYVAVEPHLISTRYRMHGTADLVVRINYETGLWVGDWKTSAKQSETHPIQLAVYALMWNESHPDQLIDQGFIARVDKKSKGLKVKIDRWPDKDKGTPPLSAFFPVVKALRVIYDYINGAGDYKN